MATFLDKLFEAEGGESTYLLVFGYIRAQQTTFLMDIPNGIIIEFLRYYIEFKTLLFKVN